MKQNISRQNIQSALIMCRPNFNGFFYSSFLESFFNLFLNLILSRKKALWLGTVNSHLGNSALIVLPPRTMEMKSKSFEGKEKEILKGVKLAKNLGAEQIAFAGLLPSLLNHFTGLTHKELIQYKEQITTGHTMTCIGLGSVFQELLKKTFCQTLSVVGLGSIGSSSLVLLLEKILKPKKIILCDLPKRKTKLMDWSEDIQKTYSIPVEPAFYGEKSFVKVYEGDMLLGAVSSKNVLNPKLLKKGSILVDDSFPPIISVRGSIDRMKEEKDVLILSGGRMKMAFCHWTSELWQLPQFLISAFLQQMGSQGLPGCWLEALVYSYQKAEFKQKIKPQQPADLKQKYFIPKENILKAWKLKDSLNLTLPDFHFFQYRIPPTLIETVHQLRQRDLA